MLVIGDIRSCRVVHMQCSSSSTYDVADVSSDLIELSKCLCILDLSHLDTCQPRSLVRTWNPVDTLFNLCAHYIAEH